MISWYECVWPLVRLLPAELSHALGMAALRVPFPLGGPAVADAFVFRGHHFRNRVGLAAGFDKNASVLSGVQGLGPGFAEIGTIVTRPWGGNPRPRMDRVEADRAIWNRLGFPSDGLACVAERLSRFRAESGFCIGCNIAPHPLTVRGAAEDPGGFLKQARAEFQELLGALHPFADFFVMNLSSPNTQGLRELLYGDAFAGELVAPARDRIRVLDRDAARPVPTLLLVKLPPEDAERRPWTPESLAPLATPLAAGDVSDGFVAVNTSMKLALEYFPGARPEQPGGLSGAPLLPLASATLAMLREIAGSDALLVGVGGVQCGDDACALAEAGADLVELYSGLIYRGPGLLRECAEAMAARRTH